MTDTLSASCHCGAIHLTLPADAVGILACHCGGCQKIHGNFNAFLAAPRDAITVHSDTALVWHQSSEGNRRAFCGTCGSRVVKKQTAARRWLISARLIDGPSGRRILKYLWAQSKPERYALPEVPARAIRSQSSCAARWRWGAKRTTKLGWSA